VEFPTYISTLCAEITDELIFTEDLRDAHAQEKDKSVILECSLSKASTQVEWRFLRDGGTVEAVLRDNPKYQLRSEGSCRYLRVSDVALADAGNYSCVTINQQGNEVRTSAHLTVQGQSNHRSVVCSRTHESVRCLYSDEGNIVARMKMPLS